MSHIVIKDGAGTGKSAKVDDDNRLLTATIAEPYNAHVSKEDGLSFILASDFVSLSTTGSFNGIMYIKNTSASNNMFIQRIRVCGTETGSIQCRLISNPTAGTLVSDANAADQLNANLSSSNQFSAQGLVYAASGDGKTVTDGSNLSNFIIRSPGHGIQEYEGSIILGPGDSIALTCKPSAATTLCAEAQVFVEPRG